jgi:hypothetical protein
MVASSGFAAGNSTAADTFRERSVAGGLHSPGGAAEGDADSGEA